MRDDLVRRGRPPFGLVLGCVGVADQGRVVSPGERAVECRADAGVGLGADDDEAPHAEARQHGLEGGGLEGIAIVLLDQRLAVARRQLRNDPPGVASPRKPLVGVLDPHDGDPFAPRLLDQAADIGDDGIALMITLDDALLDIDDEECGVRSVL